MKDGALRQALKEQYHAGLAMLDECVERCPEDLWLAGEHPRTFWRIAWHAAFFAQFYLVQDQSAFNRSAAELPPAVRAGLGVGETRTVDTDPYGLPTSATPLTRQELREYIAHVRDLVDATVDALDLASPESGYPWYPRMTKLSHELLNLRHIQGHVGQLSELLMARGIDTRWVGKAGAPLAP